MRKRANGAGTAFKRGSTWTVRITRDIISGPDGKRIQKYTTKGGFKTKTDALAYAETLKNGPISSPDFRMGELTQLWLKAYAGRVSVTTMQGYRAALSHYDFLMNRPVSSVRQAEIQTAIDECGAGKRTKQMMKVVIGLLMKYALDNQIIDKNPAVNLYTGKDAVSTHEPFTDLELERIRRCGLPYADYVLALCYTGFRPGELLALKKSALNLERWYLIGGGKTEAGTDRIVTVPPAVRQILYDRMQANSDYLFPNLKTGEAMNHNYFRKFCFEPLMDQLGIENRVPYSCRHTYSNLLKNASGDSGDKARLMGHTVYAFTQGRYQSSSVEDLERITDQLV